MKRIITNYCFIFILMLVFGLIGTVGASAQTSLQKKEILTKLLGENFEKNPFIILTPEDLRGLSKQESELLIATAGDPCNTAVPIAFGANVNGQLSTSDCQLEDNSYADFYSFNGVEGRQVTINLSSTVFDTYLGLATETGTFVWEDDDGGGGTNSRIIADLPETGLYIILTNSLLPNQTGAYTLSLADTTPCRFTLTPNFQLVPAPGGDFSFTVTANDQTCVWTATSFAEYITTNSSGTGNGTVNYSVTENTGQFERFGNLRVNNTVFSVRQQAILCTLSFDPPSADFPAAGGSGTFQVLTQPGCSWTADGDSFTSSNSSGTGNGTVSYTVQNNNGAARMGGVRVTTYQTNSEVFTVNQEGRNCTYATSDREIHLNRLETTGVVNMITQPGCTWSVTSNVLWIELSVTSGTGPGPIPYRILPHTEPGTRWGVISPTGVTSVSFYQKNDPYRIPFDFDGDSRTDISIFRPGAGEWWYLRSSDSGNRAFAFGIASDRLTPGDFTGDGRADIAFWRETTGEWFILRSEDASFYSFPFGASGDIPAPGDFDGDGRTDPAVFRPSEATWYILNSTGGTTITQFGANGDKPVVADYDRDGRADIAIFRPDVGQWWIWKSGNGTVKVAQFGTSEDIPAPEDFSGDDADDIAFFRPSTGEWFVLRSENDTFFSFPFGAQGDIPVPGDYDRDGIADAAVFRPSNNTWYLNKTTDGFEAITFGAAGDKPVPNAR